MEQSCTFVDGKVAAGKNMEQSCTHDSMTACISGMEQSCTFVDGKVAAGKNKAAGSQSTFAG